MTILPFGPRAVLIEVATLTAALDLQARLSDPPDGVVDIVPAARTVLVHVDPAVLPVAAARAWIDRATRSDAVAPERVRRDVDVPIVYDGPDLDETALLLGLSREALTAAHTSAAWTVAFTGFAPGFGYLVSEDWAFDVARLPSPRPRVAAGAVGLAGVFSGAYPRATPGGWRLIGTTEAPLFDPTAAEPALLTPGTAVRFVPVRAAAVAASASGGTGEGTGVPAGAGESAPVGASAGAGDSAPAQTGASGTAAARSHRAETDGAPVVTHADPARAGFTVLDPGLLATIQDQGRPGHAAAGVAVSGAADREALRTGLRLVGTGEHAAGAEVTLGGFRAVADVDLWVAVTGAWGAVRLGGRVVDAYAAHLWRAGAELHLDWFAQGARAYICVRGGLDAPGLFGSRATDTLAGLGPRPLRAGDRIGRAQAEVAPIPAEDLHPWSPPVDAVADIPLAPGPRADWFAPQAQQLLYDTVWTVSSQADRVGIRLDGPALPRTITGELPSEGMLPGAVQVPPDGRPVLFGRDAPVTGGYPVIAVATAIDALGQMRPGSSVRFRHAR